MGRSLFAVSRRVAVLWALEVVALWLLARVLPGLSLNGWHAAVLGVAAIALLNALARPLLLFLTLPFTVLSFGLLTLLLNGVVLWLATLMVPSMHLSDLGTGVIAALGLTLTNTLGAFVFAFNDEESVYRNVMLRIARRSAPGAETKTPGLLLIEFDGLSAPLLERAAREGFMPTLSRWMQSGAYRLVRWDCGAPSQTSSSQAGILFGNNFDIPAFRWFDKTTGETMVSNDPDDAMRIEARVSRGGGLLHDDGISICNMFTGDAPRSIATISSFSERQVLRTSPIYFSFYVSPYNFTRALVLIIRELMIEWWERLRQRVRNVRPRVSRGGLFPLLRAMSTVAQRELGTYTLIHQMFASVPMAYMTYVGYDVVAHHAGPESHDALRVLRDLDRRVAMIERAAGDSPRPYRFVVLSDHGQTRSIPFRQAYGITLEHLVRDLLGAPGSVVSPPTKTEGYGHLNTLLTEAIRYDRLTGRAARRLLRRKTRGGLVQLGHEPESRDGEGEVVVCASGNLAHVYFRQPSERMTLEEIAADHPGLLEGLVGHAGIAFVVVRSSQHGGVVMGREGIRFLAGGRVEGVDPLEGYSDHAPRQLARLEGFPHCGDIVLNGCYDSVTGLVVTFEEMVGTHGGLGGPQNDPFVLFPSAWPMPEGRIHDSEQLFQVFTRWRDMLHAGDEPPGGHVDATFHNHL